VARKRKSVPTFPCPHCGTQFSVTELGGHLDQTACGVYLRGQLGLEFQKDVEVNVPTKDQQVARERAAVYVSKVHTKVVLVLRTSDDGMVTCIPHDAAGLRVVRIPAQTFEAQHTCSPEYPPGRCARHYVEFARLIGATAEVIAELRTLVDVMDDEAEIAAQRLSTNKAERKVTKVVATKVGDVAIQVAKRGKKDSAAEMFRGLIMEGQLSDEEIVARVAEVHGGNKNVTHVSYYRSQLRRSGLNPPAKKSATKKSAAKKSVAKKSDTNKKSVSRRKQKR
jgi:hypothetical protein